MNGERHEERHEERGYFEYVVPGEVQTLSTQLGILNTLKVAAQKTGGAYSLFELAVESGGGEQLHIQHREDEYLYVLSGSFELVIESEVLSAGEGASFYISKGTLHGYENVGDRPGNLLAIYTPGGPHERFIEESGELVREAGKGLSNSLMDQEAYLERLRVLGARYGVEIVAPHTRLVRA